MQTASGKVWNSFWVQKGDIYIRLGLLSLVLGLRTRINRIRLTGLVPHSVQCANHKCKIVEFFWGLGLRKVSYLYRIRA